jgi:hypothetical protein
MGTSESSQYRPHEQREASLHRAYSVLRQTASFSDVSRQVDEHQWVHMNLLLDQGHSEVEAAKRMGLHVNVVALIKNPRRCLELHANDPEALRKCLEGEN